MSETETRSLQLLMTGYKYDALFCDAISIDFVFASLSMRLLVFHLEYRCIPSRRHWRRSGIFIVNFEPISHHVLVFLLLTLSR